MCSAAELFTMSGICGTKAIAPRRASMENSASGTPPISIRPAVGSRSLGSMSTRVDLPPPEGPTRAVRVQAGISRVMPFRAGTSRPG
jgi:hypothetical protein